MTIQQKILTDLLAGKTLKAIQAHELYQCQENTLVKCIHYLRNGINCDDAYDIRSEIVENNGKKFAQYWLDTGTVKQSLRQSNCPCNNCGSWYRRGNMCNICGVFCEAA